MMLSNKKEEANAEANRDSIRSSTELTLGLIPGQLEELAIMEYENSHQNHNGDNHNHSGGGQSKRGDGHGCMTTMN
ncbi:hypothetical protein HPP92_009762 [Vanilla planifolia]|uniref:Uncharacterized protein n=1 Tax=Vanilla planifolia TaxID=51239 RepID=A0A835R8I1_VANPL|nr:hypothetical protein HPP92_009762 [Vanilla planifolia]